MARQLRTVARQCYAWTLPYGASFTDKTDVKEGHIVSDALKERLEMLSGTPGFTARCSRNSGKRTWPGRTAVSWPDTAPKRKPGILAFPSLPPISGRPCKRMRLAKNIHKYS